MHNRVKGAMELGLSSCESSDAEDERQDTLDKAIKDTTGWVDLERAKDVPKLLINNIYRYFITRRVRKDQVAASKPYERGYRIYNAKKVRYISINSTADDGLLSVIKASVPNRSTCVFRIVSNSCVTDCSSLSTFVYSSFSLDNLVEYACNCSVKFSSLLRFFGWGGVNRRTVGGFLTDKGTVQGKIDGILLSGDFLES